VFDDRGRVYRHYCWLMADMFARRRRPQPLTVPAVLSVTGGGSGRQPFPLSSALSARPCRDSLPSPRGSPLREPGSTFGSRPASFDRVVGTSSTPGRHWARRAATGSFAPRQQDHIVRSSGSRSCARRQALAVEALVPGLVGSKRCRRRRIPNPTHLGRSTYPRYVPARRPLAQIKQPLPQSVARGFRCGFS